MAVRFYNRAKMTVAQAPNTGTFVLGQAAEGFQDFADAGVTHGVQIRYAAEQGINWEFGTSTVSLVDGVYSIPRNPEKTSNLDNSAIIFDSNTKVFASMDAADVVQSLEDLTNVSSAAPNNGEFLKWDGGSWTPALGGTTYTVQDGELSERNFTHALKGKLDDIEQLADVTDTANVVASLTAGTNINIASDGTISSTADSLPTQSSNAGKYLKTNGTTVSWESVSSGGSGTNTGDQTITLTGEVTGSGTGSFAATVADNVVDEANLKVSNNPINGYVLTAQSGNTGGLTWEEVPTNYTLPTAAANTLGGVKVGNNLSIDGSGVLSASGGASYSVGDGGLTSNDFTDADHSKLDGIEASANNYVHPNHSGEVTSSADGATVIADNVVDEANLKVSNTPTDGYVLTAQSGNTGGLTWAEASSGGGGGGGGAFSTIGTYDNNIYGISPTAYAPNNTNTSGTSLTTGIFNWMNGHKAGESISSGGHNVLFGQEAGASISTTVSNLCVGYKSGNLTTGVGCVALGPNAMKSATTGNYNVSIGIGSMMNAGSAGYSIGIGANALQGTTSAPSTGDDNIGIGLGAGQGISSGSDNVCLGRYAGYNIFSTTGRTSTGSGNTIIGKYSHAASNTVSNSFTLGGTNITSLRCNDTSISSLSDERDKTDIQDTTLGLDFIKDVRPVEFTWDRRDGSMGSMKDVGFIAQELWDTELKHSTSHRTRMVKFDNPDRLEAAPNRMFPILVKAVQELAAKNEELETRLAALEG